jgi:threonine/homoserine/homoserine lactone efflux protein
MIQVAALFLGIFLAQVSPGPNLMAVSSASLGSGRMLGISTAAGIATGVFICAVLFALGIGAFLNAFPQAITSMRFLGGGYLIYLSVQALRSACRGKESAPVAARSKVNAAAAYRRGLVVVMTNPKAALMWVAISMYVASMGLPALTFLAIGIGASASAMLVYGAYALLFSTGVFMRGYARFSRYIEASFGAVFGIFGANLVLDGVREFKA